MADKKGTDKDKPAEERLLTIPLRMSWLKAPMNRRARQSIKTVKAFISRHMKIPEADIRISAKLNNTVWIRGAGKPPSKIRIKASLDASTGNLHATLPEEEAPKAKEEKKPSKEEKPTEEPAKAEKPEETKAEASKKETPKPEEKPKKTEKKESKR